MSDHHDRFDDDPDPWDIYAARMDLGPDPASGSSAHPTTQSGEEAPDSATPATHQGTASIDRDARIEIPNPAETLPEDLTYAPDQAALICDTCGDAHPIPTIGEGGRGLEPALTCCEKTLESLSAYQRDRLQCPRVPAVADANVDQYEVSRTFLRFVKLVDRGHGERLHPVLEYRLDQSMSVLRRRLGLDEDDLTARLETQATDPDRIRWLRKAKLGNREYYWANTEAGVRDRLGLEWTFKQEWGPGIADRSATPLHRATVNHQLTDAIRTIGQQTGLWDRVAHHVEQAETAPWVTDPIKSGTESQGADPVYDLLAFRDDRPVLALEHESCTDSWTNSTLKDDTRYPSTGDLVADHTKLMPLADVYGTEIVFTGRTRAGVHKLIETLGRELDAVQRARLTKSSRQTETAEEPATYDYSTHPKRINWGFADDPDAYGPADRANKIAAFANTNTIADLATALTNDGDPTVNTAKLDSLATFRGLLLEWYAYGDRYKTATLFQDTE